MSIRLHKTCKQCNAWYVVPVYSRRANSKYCSLSCTTTYRNKTDNPASRIEAREKISNSRKGKPSYKRTKETLDEMKASITGVKHWNWQGGKTSETVRQRNSADYRSWRKQVYERDNYTCCFCGTRGGHLNADHIKSWAYYPELRFDIDNGRTLCLECHYKTDTFGSKNIKRAAMR